MRAPALQRRGRTPSRLDQSADATALHATSSREAPGTARPSTLAGHAPSSKRAFTSTVTRYVSTVLPLVTRELHGWAARARAIPDPALRELASDALSKRGNMEGAALFAVLAPRRHRRQTVRALVAFQTAYNYLDTLAEQPTPDPIANGTQLHQALLVALDPGGSHVDYYARYPRSDDGGFLPALVDTCRAAFATLPSHSTVAPAIAESAARIVSFQSLNLTEHQGSNEALERWAREQTPAGSGLHWWATAGAGGSSLTVHALIAAAADPDLDAREITAIQDAYFPWICALHSLLDSFVDLAEDEAAGQRNLLRYYANPQQATLAMRLLAQRAHTAVDTLPQRDRHRVILAAMASYYLSSPEASAPGARSSTAAVADAVGPLMKPALALFRARRAAARVVHGGYR